MKKRDGTFAPAEIDSDWHMVLKISKHLMTFFTLSKKLIC